MTTDRDIIPVRLPSGTKAIIDLPRPFTVADATHLVAFLVGYIEDHIPDATKMVDQNTRRLAEEAKEQEGKNEPA